MLMMARQRSAQPAKSVAIAAAEAVGSALGRTVAVVESLVRPADPAPSGSVTRKTNRSPKPARAKAKPRRKNPGMKAGPARGRAKRRARSKRG
jgi:hypothetical protein